MALFLFLLVSGVGCDFCLWLFLDFSLYLVLVVRSVISTSSLAVFVACDFYEGFCFVFISLGEVGFVFETGAFSLGFRICLSFVVFIFTLFLVFLLSVSFGCLYDLFGSIFYRACGLFVILFRVSV